MCALVAISQTARASGSCPGTPRSLALFSSAWTIAMPMTPSRKIITNVIAWPNLPPVTCSTPPDHFQKY